MDAKKYRRITLAKQDFLQAPEQHEFSNVFGIEDTNVAPTKLPQSVAQLPHLQQPILEQSYHEQLPSQTEYQHVQEVAHANPNDILAQQQYHSMTQSKLSGMGKSTHHDTEIYLRRIERDKILRRSIELAKRRKISTASERPSFFS